MARLSRSVVACFSLDGKLIKVYPSAKKAAANRHLYPRTIDRCIRGDITTVKGLQWKRFNIDEVPEYYINAIIAVEDHRFKEHGPVDYISITRAIVSNIQSKDFNEGGSTITQQVAKNLYFIGEKDVVSRKIAEIFLAIELENNYSKDDILEFYINTIYFGEGYY